MEEEWIRVDEGRGLEAAGVAGGRRVEAAAQPVPQGRQVGEEGIGFAVGMTFEKQMGDAWSEWLMEGSYTSIKNQIMHNLMSSLLLMLCFCCLRTDGRGPTHARFSNA